MERHLQANGFDPEKLNVVAQIDNPEAIKSSVSRNLGVSVLSVLAAREEILSGRLLPFELGEQGAFRQIYMVWREGCALTEQEQAFLDFVRKRPMVGSAESSVLSMINEG